MLVIKRSQAAQAALFDAFVQEHGKLYPNAAGESDEIHELRLMRCVDRATEALPGVQEEPQDDRYTQQQ